MGWSYEKNGIFKKMAKRADTQKVKGKRRRKRQTLRWWIALRDLETVGEEWRKEQ